MPPCGLDELHAMAFTRAAVFFSTGHVSVESGFRLDKAGGRNVTGVARIDLGQGERP
jgi:hypothetical protein